jgi:hypothetical protein
MASKSGTHKNIFDYLKEGLYEAAASSLYRICEEATPFMKRQLSDHHPFPVIGSGELHDSITYGIKGAKTAKYFPSNETKPGNPTMKYVGGRAKTQHVISEVKTPLTAVIGTADPKGKYVDGGTGPHKTPRDSDEFVRNVKDWCFKKGFDEDFAQFLIKRIRRYGTSAVPFREPTKQFVEQISKVHLDHAVSAMIRKMPRIKRHISSDGIHTSISFGR